MEAIVGVHGDENATAEASQDWPVPRFVERRLGRFDQRSLSAWIIGIAAVVAFLIRWTQDDSFISLRYARNFVEGHGLVYNPGDNVEGYTNFLWTMLMAIPLKLGRDPVLFGHLIGVASMCVTLLATIRIATRIFDSKLLGNFTALILLTNLTFIAYATGGLETQLQTALIMCVWGLAIPTLLSPLNTWQSRTPPLRTVDLLLLSVAAGLAILTRLDSVLIIVVPAIAVFWVVLRARKHLLVNLIALVVPVLILVVPWTVWRLDTYGSLIPNTAVAKENTLRVSLLQGMSFLFFFIVLNLLFVFVPTAVVRGREVLVRRPFVAVSATLGLWILYLLKVGADFMEFRFMVAVLPLLSLVLVGLICRTRSEVLKKVLVSSLVAGLVVHFAVLGATGGIANLDTIPDLNDYVANPMSGEIVMGKELRTVLHGSEAAELPGSGSAIIASSAAGAIPYFARLRAIDPLGLNDRWTARHGLLLDSRKIPKPGHTRMSTFAYLNEQDVNLLVGFRGSPRPDGYDMDDLYRIFREAEPDVEHLRRDATMIEMPMQDGTVYALVYLKPHPDIDAAVRSGRWHEVPLDF
ncbi:MAG: hypothetical protein WBA45_08720 [Microthrixaceae bacterium]